MLLSTWWCMTTRYVDLMCADMYMFPKKGNLWFIQVQVYVYLYLYVQCKILCFVLLILAGCDRMNKWFGLATVMYRSCLDRLWKHCAVPVQIWPTLKRHVPKYTYSLAYYAWTCSLPYLDAECPHFKLDVWFNQLTSCGHVYSCVQHYHWTDKMIYQNLLMAILLLTSILQLTMWFLLLHPFPQVLHE